MCSMDEARRIVDQMSENIRSLFPLGKPDVILFGSYARSAMEDGSDIDVMYLVDASRQEIADKSWQIGTAAANLLLEHGVVVSPVVENRDYFLRNAEILPFFRNIKLEGVRIGG